MINEKVVHKKFGGGTITAVHDSDIIIDFPKIGEKNFQFPEGFVDGFIKMADESRQEELVKIIEKNKRIDAEKKQVELAALQKEKIVKNTEKNTNSFSKRKLKEIIREGNERLYFYVFQGSSYQSEKNGSYIWAPIQNEKGQSMHHWERMLDVRAGDIILHGVDGFIPAISIARGKAYSADRPLGYGDEQWNLAGRKVDLDYTILERPLQTKDFINEIKEFSGQKYGPFNINGTGNMGYLFNINVELASIFVKWIVRHNPNIINVAGLKDLL